MTATSYNITNPSIKTGDIFYFINFDLETLEPHPHIVVAKTTDDILVLVCCTSKVKKRMEFIQRIHYPFETLVICKPSAQNGLNKETAIDCNSHFDYTKEYLNKLSNQGLLDYKGIIEEYIFEQIKKGLNISDLIEEETKEIIINTQYRV